MREEPFVIKKSKIKLLLFVLIVAGFILYFFLGPYEKTRIIFKGNPMFAIVILVTMFVIFFYPLKELISQKAEIILSAEGIDLRDKGFFKWSMIESFKTVYDFKNKELVLQTKEFAEVNFEITYLEKNQDELALLILEYKGQANILYIGHESK